MTYLLAQAARDARVRKALGNLTQAKAARLVGTTPRSLVRYLTGERIPPERIGLRIIDLAQELSAQAREVFNAIASDELVPVVSEDGFPIKVERYKTPRIVEGVAEPSRIIVVDVQGMTNAQVERVIVDYWRYLGKTNQGWDLRLQANIEVQQYFGEKKRDIQDKSLRSLVAGKELVELWLPPQPFVFQRPKSRQGVFFLRYPSARAMLFELNQAFVHPTFGRYADRLPLEYTFSKLAFIPVTAPRNVKRYNKRRGKR